MSISESMEDLKKEFDFLSFDCNTPSTPTEQSTNAPRPKFGTPGPTVAVTPVSDWPTGSVPACQTGALATANSSPTDDTAPAAVLPLCELLRSYSTTSSPSADSEPSAEQEGSMASFGPTTGASDPIVDAILAFTRSERCSNFAFLGRYNHIYMNSEDLAVYLSDAEDITRVCTRWSLSDKELADCKWYTFRQTFSGLTDTVPLRYPKLLDVPSDIKIAYLDVLDVGDTQTWMNIRSWMRKKLEWHDTYDWKFRLLQHEEQDLWWRLNGLHFRLLDLPGELREAIYLETIGPILVPQMSWSQGSGDSRPEAELWSQNRFSLGRGISYGMQGKPGARLDPDIERPNLSILLVSRQVYREALDAVSKLSTKRFRATAPSDLDSYNPRMGTGPPILLFRDCAPPTALTNIQLEFSAAACFEFIGIRPRSWDPLARIDPPAVHIGVLQTIKTLRVLDFRFMSSKHPHAVCPWSLSAGQNAHTARLKHSCQKEWIDWFFTFAYEQFVDCKFRITMSGCIKDSTRTKWEPILRQLHKGLAYDFTPQANAIRLLKVDHHPIPCHCTIPCYDEVDGENGDPWSRFDRDDRREVVGLQEEIEQRYWSFKD